MLNIRTQIASFKPLTAAEKIEQQTMFQLIEMHAENLLHRKNSHVHFTSSALILNRSKTKTLMVHHNIYNSWGWTGGHNDGNPNFLAVAIKEAQEETGINNIVALTDQIHALDMLPVFAHIKNGQHIPAHLHLNVAFLLIADDTEPIKIKPDENSAVKWLTINEMRQVVTEPHMLAIYEKLLRRGLDSNH